MMEKACTMQLIEADWPAPASVRAFTTTRSLPDEALLASYLPEHSRICRLRQVHGRAVVNAAAQGVELGTRAQALIEADACFSRAPRHACRVLTADCLPVLICNEQGTEVAAVHAGWRGLAAGVIENCVAQLRSAPAKLLVWLGPAISQDAFEVGEEVCSAFVSAAPDYLQDATRACFRAAEQGKYFADLYALARLRLNELGISRVTGGDYCTFSQTELFYSYRRDASSGRMISVIVFVAPH
jgi:YfiH family protein